MPQKPVWSEGVLVSQHHFQQQDRYHEELLRDRVSALAHYDWGITTIEIDSRPSDAIALGVASLVPIYVADHVLDEVS